MTIKDRVKISIPIATFTYFLGAIVYAIGDGTSPFWANVVLTISGILGTLFHFKVYRVK